VQVDLHTKSGVFAVAIDLDPNRWASGDEKVVVVRRRGLVSNRNIALVREGQNLDGQVG